MRSQSIPPVALEFIENHIASTEELELLVAIVEAPSRWWDPGMVSRELRIPTTAARSVLDRFVRLNLLEIRITGEVRYRFQPATVRLRQTAAAIAAAVRSGWMPRDAT